MSLSKTTSEWQPISTAPKGTEIRVRMADGSVIERAHWACDLSGEEQPPFRGWFRPVTASDGRVLYYSEIGEPVEWMTCAASSAGSATRGAALLT